MMEAAAAAAAIYDMAVNKVEFLHPLTLRDFRN